MNLKLKNLALGIVLAGVFAGAASSQTPSGRRGEDPLSKSIREKLTEMRIDEEKEEYRELTERCEEAARLSEEIHESFTVNKKMTPKDREKLSQVEDLSKRIRKDLRAGKDKSKQKPPGSTAAAVKYLLESTAVLFEEIKNNSRHSVSVAAIQTSNKILKLVRFLKIRKD